MTYPLEPFYKAFCAEHRLPSSYADAAERWFEPLAQRLFQYRKVSAAPLIVGINGCQGSGKSTLADLLARLLVQAYGLRAVALSLDDFYLSKLQRQRLADQVHPLLQTRGVPGTHDVNAILRTLEQLSQATGTVALPRFDKANDNPQPQQQWPRIAANVDIILLEGWCMGATPQTPEQLQLPINQLEANHDVDGSWRRYVNQQLGAAYQTLFSRMQLWIMLQAPGFDCVYQWRLQQEQKLAAANHAGKALMSEAEIAQFIQHYQRLTEHCLATLPAQAHFLYTLDSQRQITAMLHPQTPRIKASSSN